MQTFNNTVFKLNPNATWETVDTPIAKVTIIDDFYEDFDSVYAEADKLPAAPTFCNDPDEIVDYRKSYAENMPGTELPYTTKYTDLVKEIIQFGGIAHTDTKLLINCNRLLCDRHKDNWYNIHQDPPPSDMWNDIISTVVMLNKHYDESEGINFYYHAPTTDGNWFAKETVRRSFFVQGKPNRAILFSPQMWHGAAFGTDQFKDEYRYTQVIFTNLR